MIVMWYSFVSDHFLGKQEDLELIHRWALRARRQ